MVETEDKDSVVPTTETKAEETPAAPTPAVVTEQPASQPDNKPEPEQEAKETDKMLEKSEDDKKEEKVDEGKEKKEEVIDIPAVAEEADKKTKEEKKEKRKIPIGGIKMPGFFTKKQPKNKDKAGDEGTELLENEKKEEEKEPEPKPEEEPKEPAPPSAGFFSKFKFSNPFAKKPTAPVDPEAPAETAEPEKPAEEEKKEEEKAEPETKEEPKEGEETKPEESKEEAPAPTAEEPQTQPKKSLLSSIKLPPLSSIIPKRFQRQQQDDIEMGNGPQARAGLASMETLDDSLKDQESKDTTDTKPAGEVKTEPNGNGAKADEQKAEKENEENDKNNTTLGQRLRGYKCSIDDFAIIAGIILFLILVALILAFTFVGGAKEAKIAPVRDGKFILASTSCGIVEGIYEDNAFAFRGIPYAKKPIGDLRFAPSELIDNPDLCWNETFFAHNATSSCWQLNSDGSFDGDEDCLTLDVVSPQVRYDNPLPVVVLIGAESLTGGSPNILRPSAVNARARDVVFVRPNFRVNALGFLAADQISKVRHPKTSGNYGLSDIITALKWIKMNVAHFGGDAKNVILVGHRAGGTLVTALVTSNKTNELFARAWISSGSVIFTGKELEESESANKVFYDRLPCPEDKKDECLFEVEAEELVKQVPGEWIHDALDLPTANENNTVHHDWLVMDGEILKKHPTEVLSKATHLPKLVFGSTAHNAHSQKLLKRFSDWTPELVRQHIQNSKVGAANLTDEAISRYGENYKGLVAMISDIRTVCPLYALTKSIPKPTHFYFVSQTGGELEIADQDIDILAILGRFEPKTVEQKRYISAIQTLFYHYISHGTIQNSSPVLEVGQDVAGKQTLPNCDFWMDKDFVPKYGRYD